MVLKDKRRAAVVAVIACSLSVPVGYAIASELTDDRVDDSGFVAIEDCPAEVQAAAAEGGWKPDTYSGSCPTAEDAKAEATEINLMRRNGLTRIVESIRRYGGPDDAAKLEELEAELDALGGPYKYPSGEPPEN